MAEIIQFPTQAQSKQRSYEVALSEQRMTWEFGGNFSEANTLEKLNRVQEILIGDRLTELDPECWPDDGDDRCEYDFDQIDFYLGYTELQANLVDVSLPVHIVATIRPPSPDLEIDYFSGSLMVVFDPRVLDVREYAHPASAGSFQELISEYLESINMQHFEDFDFSELGRQTIMIADFDIGNELSEEIFNSRKRFFK